MRTNSWQINQWGKTIDGQRSDLWLVDLESVVKTFRTAGLFSDGDDFYGIDTSYYASTVALPELKVNAEVVRRDSRPYNMPSWDDPLGAIRVTFIHDVGQTKVGSVQRSEIMKLLTVWRAVVRAGRGGMSTEDSFILGAYYNTARELAGTRQRLDAHNIALYLLKGAGMPGQEATGTSESELALDDATRLETSTKYVIQNAWLSSFQVSELNYNQQTQLVTVSATFFAEDISLFSGRARRYMEAL
jgi:hypothetical protein